MAQASGSLPNLEDLRLVVAALDGGSLSNAAQVLGLTQPTVSWRLEKLEERMATELFVRSKRGVHATRAGRLLAARGRELLERLESLGAELRAESEEVRGRYSIGVNATLGAQTLPAFVPDLLTRYPELELDIAHGISRDIARDVLDFRYDLGIVVNPPRHPELTIVNLYPDEVRLWKGHGVRRSQWGRRIPLIYSPAMTYVDKMIAEARERGILDALRHVHTVDLHVIARLTAAGAGVGVLPATIARAESPDGIVALRKTPIHSDDVALIWRHDSQRTQASAVIRRAIIDGIGAGR